MICLTGGEATIQALARRLEGHPAAELQEVRLDLLDPLDGAVFPLLSSPRIIATCRGGTEGGGFAGTPQEQAQILARALDQGPGYLDLDRSLPRELRRELIARRDARAASAGSASTQVILSYHDFGPGGAATLGRLQLSAEPADLLKVAVAVEDAAELGALHTALCEDPRPVLRIGMGDPGLISRALYSRFGSPWTYAVSDEEDRVAPGQLTIAQATRWRVAEAAELTPLGLVGGAQVMSSPGPGVYNDLFTRHGWPWIYLPVVTARPAETHDLLMRLGFSGYSVTMPGKEILARTVDEVRPPARELGAINTLLLVDGSRRSVGFNTDGPAVYTLLRPSAGEPSLVLGGGGAARAAIHALQQLGCPVTVTCRRQAQADALRQQLQINTIPWDRRHQDGSTLVVNATPLGSDGATDPLCRRERWANCAVLDMVISEHPTPLLRRAASAGARALSGLQMWFLQGALQMQLLLERPVTAEELEELCRG